MEESSEASSFQEAMLTITSQDAEIERLQIQLQELENQFSESTKEHRAQLG